MKKKTLMGILGLVVLLSSMSVNAETLDSVEDGSNNVEASVVVGDVEVPVYEVSVIWNDLTFDWVYDEDAETFGWKPALHCTATEADQTNIESLLGEGNNVYSDSSCSVKVNSYSDSITTYYYSFRPDYVTIGIEDKSSYGQIVPSIKWNANSKYSDIVAKFKYSTESCISIDDGEVFNVAKVFGVFADSSCTNIVEPTTFQEGKYYALAVTGQYQDLETDKIPDNGRVPMGIGQSVQGMGFSPIDDSRNAYSIKLYLEGVAQTPETGDTIGTITVTIKAAE